jgi:hypothetical protein
MMQGKNMSLNKREEPFIVRFIDARPKFLLELTNTTDLSFKSVEILTVFLKDEGPLSGSSRVHIKFDAVQSIQPKGKAVLSHVTWIDGKPVEPEQDQLARLQAIAGEAKPYVLDISWQDVEGKTRYQRIPVGH